MKPFTRTLTETFTPLWVQTKFSTYTEGFIAIRSKMSYKASQCFKCHHKFVLNETIGLAAFKEVGNKVLCEECCKEILTSQRNADLTCL